MLNVIVEILQPSQNNYYKPNIAATPNNLRLNVHDYMSIEFTQDDNMTGHSVSDQWDLNLSHKRVHLLTKMGTKEL
jgi:hypothetical protein